jgi:ankyrin repeat protein
MNNKATIFELAQTGNVEKLKACPGNVNVTNEHGQTPLCLAVQGRHLDCARYLIGERDASVFKLPYSPCSPLFDAIAYGDMEYVKFLVSHGAPCDDYGAFHTATTENNLDLMKFLVEHGANVNQADTKGFTSLHWVAKYGQFDMLVYLVEKGANVNAVTQDDYLKKWTPLSLAMERKHTKCVEHLVAKGALEVSEVVKPRQWLLDY